MEIKGLRRSTFKYSRTAPLLPSPYGAFSYAGQRSSLFRSTNSNSAGFLGIAWGMGNGKWEMGNGGEEWKVGLSRRVA